MSEEMNRPEWNRELKLGKMSSLWDKLANEGCTGEILDYLNEKDNYDKNLEEVIIKLSDKVEQLEKAADADRQNFEFKTAALARQTMLSKWKIIDHLTDEKESPDDIVECKICGHKAKRSLYDTKISECEFNGGKLVRYICPECGVIFGPTKFSSLPQEAIDEDYTVHYFGYNEAVLTNKELEAFYMLNPTKDGIYLDYGCGCWSKTIEQLRADGYNVYGYEPYAPEDAPYMITSKEELKKHKFDGVFSNDLLEHLMNPVEDLKEMKKLLKTPRAAMSHSTACYIYKYEITRFHTHFFTGNSVQAMCERAGLNILDFRDEMEEKDFMCYVYGPKEDCIDYTTNLYISEYCERNGKDIIIHDKGLVCGPYMMLGPDSYKMKVCISGMNEEDIIDFKITADKGHKILGEFSLSNDENDIAFTITEFERDCEFVLNNDILGYDITLNSMDMY